MIKTLFVLMIFAFTIVGTRIYALAECTADAEVAKYWEENNGSKLRAKINAGVSENPNLKPGIVFKVTVNAKIEYETSDGSGILIFSNGSVSIDPSKNKERVGIIAIDTIQPNCTNRQPCKIKQVKITDVKCNEIPRS